MKTLIPEALLKLYDAISALPKNRRAAVAFDGRCASGKSTAAELFARIFDADVIHCDDFFLPPELRTSERYAEPGGNIHYERFMDEVVEKLPSGEDFSYGVFDCAERKITRTANVGANSLVIIEGAYATHPRFGRYYDLSVFFDVSPAVRRERIAARDGADALRMFEEKWIPFEEAYITATAADTRADLRVMI